MKRIHLIIFFALPLCFACQEEEVDWENYYATATLNDVPWEDWPHSQAYYDKEKNGTLFFRLTKFHYLNGNRNERELIRFRNITFVYDTIKLKFLRPGSGLVDSIPTVYFNIQDHDATIKTYDLLETDNFDSWLLLERAGTHELKGTFQIAVKKSIDSPPNTSYRPDTLYFTEGVFLARDVDK